MDGWMDGWTRLTVSVPYPEPICCYLQPATKYLFDVANSVLSATVTCDVLPKLCSSAATLTRPQVFGC